MTGTLTWRDLRAEAERRLGGFVPVASREASWIVEELGSFGRAELSLRGGESVTVGTVARFEDMIERRRGGEPLQYVLGHWAFRRLDLMVDRRVLIPRPETEVLVEVALERLDAVAERPPDPGPEPAPARRRLAVDLGTGSGAIALSIAVERRDVEVIGTDVSPDALAVARANLAGVGRAGSRVHFSEGSWFDALDPAIAGAVDLIVSNPPYVATTGEVEDQVRDWEPSGALFAGAEGLDALDLVVDRVPRWLAPGGACVVECAPTQTEVVAARMESRGLLDVAITADLAGRDRVVAGRVARR
ncbi:MAG: peptide chain release factor N(5)-glutamine methyltransferase [Microthrixaceae bacterium]